MRLRWLAVALCALLLLPGSASPRPAAAGPMHIHRLTASVVELGTYGSRGQRYTLLGVRLRATVCFRSLAEARNSYPDDFEITHYLVLNSPRRWLRERSVVAQAHWLVPFGETWRGPCGPVEIEDPVPPEHYGGVHALGNPRSCYGARLTIQAEGRRASKRILVQCGGFRPR
jgi:hypothetical protein